MSARLLLTGAQGFIGQYLLPCLRAAGYEVIPTARQPNASQQAAGFVALDLGSAEQVKEVVNRVQPELVIHLAALSFVAHPEPLDFYRINALGSELLLQALADLPVPPQRVLLASSATVYGRHAVGCITESVVPAPVGHYAASKLVMEQVAAGYQQAFPVGLLRFFNLIGRGQAEHFLVPKLVRAFRDRQPVLELGNLDVSRDFTDVRDAVSWVSALLDAPWPNQDDEPQIFNISAGQPTALHDLLARLQELTGHQPEIVQRADLIRRQEVKQLFGSQQHLAATIPAQPQYALIDSLRWMLEAAHSD